MEIVKGYLGLNASHSEKGGVQISASSEIEDPWLIGSVIAGSVGLPLFQIENEASTATFIPEVFTTSSQV